MRQTNNWLTFLFFTETPCFSVHCISYLLEINKSKDGKIKFNSVSSFSFTMFYPFVALQCYNV